MNRIEREAITMRSPKSIRLRALLAQTGLSVLIAAGIVALTAVLFGVKNGLFIDYLGMPSGAVLFLQSLPIIGILFALTSFAAIMLLYKQLRIQLISGNFRQAFAAAIIVVFVFGGLGGIGNANYLPTALNTIAYGTQAKPVKYQGVVADISGDQIELHVGDTIKIIDTNKLALAGIAKNDTILVLGFEDNEIIRARALSLVERYESTENETPQNSLNKQQDTEVDEPEPELTPLPDSQTAPVPNDPKPSAEPVKPKPQPKPKSISITSALKINDSKAEVKWSSNFELTKGFIVIFKKQSNPSYEDDDSYKWVFNSPGNNGIGYAKPVYGAGTYYIRVCELTSSGQCGIYSNQVTVQFEE